MSVSYNENLLHVMKLTHQMISIADQGDIDRIDRECGVIFGILRDTAFRIQEMTREEIAQHQQKGMWDSNG